jgi:nitrate/nitrite transporter NarK
MPFELLRIAMVAGFISAMGGMGGGFVPFGGKSLDYFPELS